MGVKGRGRGAPQARSGAALGADFETAVFDGRCMGVGHMRIFFTRGCPAVVWGVVGLWSGPACTANNEEKGPGSEIKTIKK